MHPAEEIKGNKSSSLNGKQIVLAVSSSIAAVKTVELARELIRNAAEVQAIMSREATGILHPNALQYATGKNVITEITGMVEHVDLFGEKGKADLLLIAPCTANLIGKIAHGIADDIVSTMALTAIGSKKKIIAVPSMHEPMWKNKIVMENIEKLKKLGVIFIQPKISENAAKFPGKKEIVLHCEREFGGKKLSGKKLLIVSGRTEDDVDAIRVLTSRASGRTGKFLAIEAFRQGATVKIIHNDWLSLHGIKEEKARTTKEFYEAVLRELENYYDWLLLPAAIGDFEVEKIGGKIASEKNIKIQLKPREKLLETVKKKFPKLRIVAFKATVGKGKQELLKIAKEKLNKEKLEIVVANDVKEKGMGTIENSVWIVSEKEEKWVEGHKKEIAKEIISEICEN